MDIRTGCISWTYQDWTGTFYPPGSKSSDFLAVYSRIFDIVEVDSTFYRTPSSTTVRQWKEKTPEGFLFTVKMPKKITHELKLRGTEKELHYFEKTIKILDGKLAAIIAQLPPSMKCDDSNLNAVSNFLDSVDSKIHLALEFRNKSWFREDTYRLLRKKDVCFVWSVNEYVKGMPKEVTADYAYLRFMGEFGKLEKLDRIQIDRTKLLQEWWKNLASVLPSVKQSFVLVSNHFAGFAPESVNQFREIAGLGKIDWKKSQSLGLGGLDS